MTRKLCHLWQPLQLLGWQLLVAKEVDLVLKLALPVVMEL